MLYLTTRRNRVKELETKISELESETDRLSAALDAQKRTTLEAQTAAAKKVEDMSKELQKKVSNVFVSISDTCDQLFLHR